MKVAAPTTVRRSWMLRTRRGRGGERVKLVGAGERVEKVELGGEGGEGGAGERGAGSECSLARRRGLGGRGA